MKIIQTLAFALMLLNVDAQAQRGEIKGPFKWKSSIFPGTVRDYWIYVPAQYNASKPACLMVVQDGLSRATGWKLPQVLDSLIALKHIPVMVGVFVDHGSVTASSTDAFPRYNRSFEYDAMGDRYVNFLLEELLPEVSKSYNISTNPDDRSIAGASSGAICAFNAAWERPDQFRRVLSTIGTYVGLRGADEFVTLVRKSEAKPLRVYLEDGDHDLNIYAGDWWMSNQAMLSALTYAGYEVNHGWGSGGHDSKHAITILAEALEWLWKDYPSPVQTHKGIAPRINLLVDGEPWKRIPLNDVKVTSLTVDAKGNVLFTDKGTVYKVDGQGTLKSYAKLKGEGKALCAGPDQLFVCLKGSGKLVSVDASGKAQDVLSNCDASWMITSSTGLYFSESEKKRIGYYDFTSKAVKFFATDFQPLALALSSEKSFLNVGAANSPFGFSFKIDADGSLAEGQAYTHYHNGYGETIPSAGGMTVDSQNLLYTATSMGIQVGDQLGRINFIFSQLSDELTNDVKIGGENFDTMYAASKGMLFSRKITAIGLTSFGPAVKPPKPGL